MYIKQEVLWASSHMIPPLRKYSYSSIFLLESNICSIFLIVTLNLRKWPKLKIGKYLQVTSNLCQILALNFSPKVAQVFVRRKMQLFNKYWSSHVSIRIFHTRSYRPTARYQICQGLNSLAFFCKFQVVLIGV